MNIYYKLKHKVFAFLGLGKNDECVKCGNSSYIGLKKELYTCLECGFEWR